MEIPMQLVLHGADNIIALAVEKAPHAVGDSLSCPITTAYIVYPIIE